MFSKDNGNDKEDDNDDNNVLNEQLSDIDYSIHDHMAEIDPSPRRVTQGSTKKL